MNSKKLTILISILLVVTLVVVLASTVFTLKTISFNFLNQRLVLADYETNNYLSGIDVPYGSSIFFVDKDKLSDSLEKKNAYLQVVSIETTFPNNIVVHASEREEVYAIRLDSDKYAITDKTLKILRFCDNAYLSRDGYLSPIVVDIDYDDIEINPASYDLCDHIDIENVTDILLNVVTAFEVSGYNITSLKGFATGINLRETGSFKSTNNEDYDLVFVKTVEISTKYGIKLSIGDAYSNLSKKVALAIKAYEMEHDKHNTTGEVLVFEQENRIIARYRQEN